MVFSVVEGEVTAEVNGTAMQASQADTVAAPTHAQVRLANRSTRQHAALFQVDDAPLQRKLPSVRVSNSSRATWAEVQISKLGRASQCGRKKALAVLQRQPWRWLTSK